MRLILYCYAVSGFGVVICQAGAYHSDETRRLVEPIKARAEAIILGIKQKVLVLYRR